MTKDELLAEAARRYPVGSVFRHAAQPSMHIKNRATGAPYWWDDEGIATGPGEGLVYYKGNWAEIISLPESENPVPYIFN